MADLLELRDRIDEIDHEIARLYEARMGVCREVGEYKIANGSKVFDRQREKEKISAESKIKEALDHARIELEQKDMEAFWQHREELTGAIKETGFTYVTLDLEGYRMGSQNEVLQKK